MAHPLLERLAEGVVLTDGAMGTMLFDTGHTADECLEQLNVTRAKDVSTIHRQYIAAGADIIESNTFGANRIRLAAHGLEDAVRDLNKRGVRLAREEREISGAPVLVAGSIGPSGRTLAPIGLTSTSEAEAIFTEQVAFLLEAGVDLLIVETMGNLDEMEAAISAARSASDLPIVAMMTFGEDGRTLTGSPPEDVVRSLSNLRVDVIGANCSVGPQRMVQVISRMRDELDRSEPGTHRPYLAAMPNAGWPTTTGGRLVYSSSPEYFADFARKVIDAGARMVGGCCGTTPAHIAAMRTVIDEINGQNQSDNVTIVKFPTGNTPVSSIMDLDESTELARNLGQKFLRCVEIDPPKGLNPQKALDGARLLKAAGVDAINVADSPMARVRMSAMTLCYLIQHEVGVETIIHFTTRDRSLMGLQSELLGAHAAGVRNVL
ncbi:MAG TPA: bifunctional homocysteine S-methyltransferase/methylenetetrahydrofolate reductase, partial [Thermomicrobiales bacterium]|nr:bifunctional homocysteine S-methyltransferase/methylenetetrahydrofolate reductase [Thermomicrobiales bacterium]